MAMAGAVAARRSGRRRDHEVVETHNETVEETPTRGFDDVMREVVPAIERVGENIMLADLGLILRYVNPASLGTLNGIAPAVRETFGLEVGQLVGGSIHRMHKDPARVERVLNQDGFTLPHKADFSFGGVTLRTYINDLRDHVTGERVGYIVSWRDITELIAERERVESLKEGLAIAGGSVDELNLAISSISSSTSDAANKAATAVDGTREMEQRITDLEHRRTEIEAAASAIDAVADQTRLLALNATIEAARAGDAGKGFAIVASEVKDLAAMTAQVTGEIGEKLAAVGAAIDGLRTQVEEMVRDIEGISDAQTSIAGAVEEQGAVAGDIGRSIGDALTNL